MLPFEKISDGTPLNLLKFHFTQVRSDSVITIKKIVPKIQRNS